MDFQEPTPSYPPENSWLDKLQAVIEVLILSGLVSGFFASLPFTLKEGSSHSILMLDARLVAASILLEAGIALGLLWLLLRAHGESARDIGLHGEGWIGDLWLGLAMVPLFFLINIVVGLAFRSFLPQHYMEKNPLTEIIRTPADLGFFLVSALVAGGFKEEMQRAFIIVRFRQHLGGARVGLIVWSLVFGAQHYVQGAQGMAAATLFGLIFGMLFLVRRSVLAPVFAHAVYDTTALLGYWFTRNLR
jgi:membrane protease YdiL (CAAX protease family)